MSELTLGLRRQFLNWWLPVYIGAIFALSCFELTYMYFFFWSLTWAQNAWFCWACGAMGFSLGIWIIVTQAKRAKARRTSGEPPGPVVRSFATSFLALAAFYLSTTGATVGAMSGGSPDPLLMKVMQPMLFRPWFGQELRPPMPPPGSPINRHKPKSSLATLDTKGNFALQNVRSRQQRPTP